MREMFFIALKNLFQEKTKLAICIGGVAFSVLLILIMNGLYQGWNVKMGAYPESIPADLWVEQKGVGDMLHALSFLPDNLKPQLEGVQGVSAVNIYLGRQTIFNMNGKDQSLFIVGFDPGNGIGKPYKMKEGDWQELKKGEIIIDEVFAKEEGLEIGNQLSINNIDLKVAGISTGGNLVSFQYAFVTLTQAREMFNLGQMVNFYLVRVGEGVDIKAVGNEIERKIESVNVLTKEEFVSKTREMLEDTFLPIIYVLVIIGLIIGIAVIGLTTYSATIEKSREYGVMKAIGITNRQLFRLVVIQSLTAGIIGYILGVGFSVLAAYLAENYVSGFVTQLRSLDLFWVFGATILMSLIAAYIPMKRIFSIDPAEVFKS